MKEATNLKILTIPKFERILPLKVHTPVTFPSENYCSVCIVIAKTFIDPAESTMARILWQDVATD